MSRIRSYVSKHLNMEEFQAILLNTWKPQLKDTGIAMCDATVYESHMRFPTDVKLLWECCEYTQCTLEEMSKKLGIKYSNKRYNKKKHAYMTMPAGARSPTN